MAHGFRNTFVTRTSISDFTDPPDYDFYKNEEFSEDDASTDKYHAPQREMQKIPVSRLNSSQSNCSDRIKRISFSSDVNRKKTSIPRELSNNPHFHKLTPSAGKEFLRNQQKGSFLIRPTKTKSCYCTLMVNTEGGVISIQIAKIDGRFCLYSDSTCSDQRFEALDDLLDYYTQNEMPCLMKGILLRDYNSNVSKGTFYLP